MRIAVIGGGAAGFFAALSAKQHNPDAEVIILEKSSKLLAKVRISGGGRCNVTHDCRDIKKLSKHYPRGEKFLRKAFSQFSVDDTVRWFEGRGVALKTESDNRMFPTTNRSETIIQALLDAARRLDVTIDLLSEVRSLTPLENEWKLELNEGREETVQKVIVTTGGHPKAHSYQWLQDLGMEVMSPVPSLFTFNMPDHPVTQLQGVSVQQASVRIQGRKESTLGPVLFTHWGMSGPAVLKLSAIEARYLAEEDYQFTIQVNWLGERKEHTVRELLDEELPTLGKRKVSNRNPFQLPQRFWEYQLAQSEIDPNKTWFDLPAKSKNRLLNHLLNDTYVVKGKTTFKEEFVTAGGVSLAGIEVQSMQSKKLPGLFFAGEVLDIDGVTGGFNFQAAWTTGWIAGKSAASG